MATFESLQERLSALQETTTQARELIAQLDSYDPTHAAEDDEQGENYASELAADTLQLLEEQRDELEEIEEEIQDLREGKSEEARHERARLVEGTRKAREGLRRTKLDLRTAQSNYISRAQTSQLRYRDAYLAEVLRPLSTNASTTGRNGSPLQNSVSSLPSNANGSGDGAVSTSEPSAAASAAREPSFNPYEARRALLGPRRNAPTSPSKRDGSPSSTKASEAVTTSLLRMHAAMSTSLERSSFAARMVEESSNSLKQLGEHYDSLDSLLEKSKGLLSVLVKSAKTDAWYLQTTVYMLLATLAWLVFRRWFYGPLWWFVWLPLRLMWGTGKAVTRAATGDQQVPRGAGVEESGGGGSAADRVVGIEKDVPTVRVRQHEEGGSSPGAEDESMIEKVGKIVDEAERRSPLLGGEDAEEVEVGDVPVGEDARQAVRDEL